MDEKEFQKLHEKIKEDTYHTLSDKERYEYMIEISGRIGTDLFLLALIENTIDYCETCVEEYNEDEIIEHIIKHSYYSIPYEISELVYEICSDLGYIIEN